MNKRRKAVYYTDSSPNGINYQNKHFFPGMKIKIKNTEQITEINKIYEDLSRTIDDDARYLIYDIDNNILSVDDIISV